MPNGIVILPISSNKLKVAELYENLSSLIDVAYVGLKDVENLQGDINLKANIIISHLKNQMASCTPYIFFDCDNQMPEQRLLITDISAQSNYLVYALMLDKYDISTKLSSIEPGWDERLKDIIIFGDN
jgi:hypothetical protein